MSAGDPARGYSSGEGVLCGGAGECSLLERPPEASSSGVQWPDLGQQDNPGWRGSGAQAV